MIITGKITVDLNAPKIQSPVHMVQGDQYSRRIEITLLSDGAAWEPPAGATVQVGYTRADGTEGNYEQLPDGSAAGSIDGNKVTVSIAPQVLNKAGRALLAVTMSLSGQEISTFPVAVDVAARPGYNAEQDTGTGGTAPCNRPHVIEVDELPVDSIDKIAVYSCGGKYYKWVKELSDVILVEGEAVSLKALLTDAGAEPAFHIISTQAADGVLPSDGDLQWHFYYVEDQAALFLYMDTEGEGEYTWVSVGDMGLTDGGTISDISQATEEGCCYAVVINGFKTYQYCEGRLEATENGVYDVAGLESVSVNCPNAAIVGAWEFNTYESGGMIYIDLPYLSENNDADFAADVNFTCVIDGEAREMAKVEYFCDDYRHGDTFLYFYDVEGNRFCAARGFGNGSYWADGNWDDEDGQPHAISQEINFGADPQLISEWLGTLLRSIAVRKEAGSGGASIDGGYAVTFMADGEEYEISSVAAGGSLSAPQIPKKDGWYFVGWYTAEADGEDVKFPYTPTADATLFAKFTETQILGFTGLSKSSGVLDWTDDIAASAGYTVTEEGAYYSVRSPLDNLFPFCDIEEFTDSSGNVFVKFPKCWIKFITNSSGVIDGFKVSNVQAEEDMFLPDCFLNPADDGATFLDYFALGKYEMSGSTSKGYSKSGATCLVSITRENARSAARAYGSATDFYKGYQLEDLSMLTLYNFLCMLYYKTANIQTVFGGRTGKGATSSWSGAEKTGTCDNIPGLNGWNTVTDCVKMLGIENPYGNIFKWIDGVYFSSGTVYAFRLPTKYADSSSGASSLGFSRPTSSGYISALKHGTGSATRSYVYASAASGGETTYVGDYCFYDKSGTVLFAGGAWSFGSNAGLWYLYGISASYSSANFGARLSYRPL